MRRQLLVLASALVLAMVSSPTFANHKDVGEGGPNAGRDHQNPPGLHDSATHPNDTTGKGPGEHHSISHNTTVNNNASEKNPKTDSGFTPGNSGQNFTNR